MNQLPAFAVIKVPFRNWVVTKRCVLTISIVLCYGINAAGKSGRE